MKLRGYRVELDEIRLAIESHDWVRHAAVIVKTDPRTGFQNLVAAVELNPKEAALMDQGNHGVHHQSKENKFQVKAQLSNAGMPGRGGDRRPARRRPARKDGHAGAAAAGVRPQDLPLLRRRRGHPGRHPAAARTTRRRRAARAPLPRSASTSSARYSADFGQHLSSQRLLPKYGYASPGSLYATQVYLEITGVAGLRPGIYYYHPVHHQLVLIGAAAPASDGRRVKLHFLGKKRAIEPVYKNNIQEVLEIETGHMVGLLEEVLPSHGLDIVAADFTPSVKDSLDVAAEDHYLGTFELVPYAGPRPDDDACDVYVQAHCGQVADLPAGQYAYGDGRLERISADLILRKHVIAINQAVYDRASFGISLVSRTGESWRQYIDLGRKLQHLSMNDLGLGFMSSGYSSRTGNALPSARRIDGILEGLGGRPAPRTSSSAAA